MKGKILMASNMISRFFALCKTPNGAISKDNAIKKIKYLKEKTKEHLNIAKDERLSGIGHQAGNYEQYPKDPKEIGPDTIDISESMKQSFDVYGLDGIEIDIQIDQENIIDQGIKGVYVVHNKPENGLETYAIEYLKRNTLEKVLEYFIDANYFEKNKHIYIEIKCDNSEKLKKQEESVIEGALNVIDKLLQKNPQEFAEKFCNHISFVSFNYNALEKIAISSNGRHSLFLIPASNRFLGWIASKIFCPQFNYLGRKLKKALSESELITGVWFDPCGVNDFGKIFNEINQKRENSGKLKPLKIFVSTYLLEENDYFDRMKTEVEGLENVDGLIFEIKS
jgi:hypothetical protein